MAKNNLVAPIIKWVGGKRQLLDSLIPLLPPKMSSYTYCEPFIGGGALLFFLQPKKAILNDINDELILLYNVVRDSPEKLIECLSIFKKDSDTFYKIREWDRNKLKYSTISEINKAARFIYLNKTCYNGLFRVNNAGEFNAPFGNYKNPNIVNAATIRAVSSYFKENDVKIYNLDYKELLKNIPKKSFVYLDPPYDPVSTTSNFTGYSKGGFTREDQIELRKCCDELNSRGIKFMLSNSATDFVFQQYLKYNIKTVYAKRSVNSDASKRGDVQEVVVRNYE